MLAYLFWHQPAAGADIDRYDDALRAFHASLGIESASFRLAELPFGAGPGYEDWYVVDDWAGLGELSTLAVDPAHRRHHDEAAALAASGWGGLYALAKGPAAIPAGSHWHEKPRRQASKDFLASLPEATVWRRELVLGPAPEFCVATGEVTGRERL